MCSGRFCLCNFTNINIFNCTGIRSNKCHLNIEENKNKQ